MFSQNQGVISLTYIEKCFFLIELFTINRCLEWLQQFLIRVL